MNILLRVVGMVVVLPRDREVRVRDQPGLQLVLQLQRVRLCLCRGVDTGADASVTAMATALLCIVVVSCMFIGGVLHGACVGTKRNE
jgi:hypothetical protein